MKRRSFLSLPLLAAVPQSNLNQLPPNLPRPKDDGGAKHLKGMPLPDIGLPSTSNRIVNVSKVDAGRIVLYCYSMTGRPDRRLPAGWDAIPGARGCTPETCGFRDHHKDLARLQAEVFGLSTQDTPYQQEMVQRLQVPFEVLSDEQLQFANALRLPTFSVEGVTLVKRLTIIARHHRIEQVFYPVFPPDTHAQAVIDWLKQHPVA
jgi:peroxiredoxin